MDIIFLVFLLIGLVSGFYLCKLQNKSQLNVLNERIYNKDEKIAEQELHISSLSNKNDDFHNQILEISNELNALKATSNERELAFEESRKRMQETFTAISAQALDQNSASFINLANQVFSQNAKDASKDLENRQNAIAQLIKPVEQSLNQFREQVQAIELSREGAYSGLRQQISSLISTQEELRTEAGNLVKALRAPQTRGRWGEFQLRKVVEMAGMLEHCDFEEQSSTDTEQGKLRPDMIVKLPGLRNIVVDAKVPLAAYLDSLEMEDNESRSLKLKDHARQVKDHIGKLSKKSYWEQFQPTPDFVILFLPGEIFYSAALQSDPSLIEAGVDQKVILATPTTLIALLRAVAYGWTQEALADNAQKISDLGKEMHDRIVTMYEHFESVGKHLNNSTKAFNQAISTLDSRVLVSARKFKELKAVTGTKEIPDNVYQIESSVREATSK
jgi:DNA recombination protein RmuC